MIGFGKIHDVSKQSGAKSGAFVVDVCLKVGPEVTLMGCLSNNSMFHLKAVHNSQITTLSLTFTSDQNNQAHKVYILQLNPLKIAFLQKSGVLFVLNLSAYFVNNKLPGNLQSLMLTTTGAIAYNSTSTLNLEQTLKTATAIVNIKQYNYVFPTHITPLPSQSNIISDDSYILCSYSDGTISVWNTNNSKNESSILYDFINTNQLTTNTDTSGLIRSSTSDSSLNTSMTSNPNHNNSVLSMLLQNAISCGQKLLVVTLQEHTIVQQTKPFITSSNNSNSHSHYVLTLHSDINDNLSNNTTRYDHTNNSNHNSHQPSSQFVQRTSITSHVNTLEMLHYISNSATDSVSSSGQLLSNVVGIYDVTVLNKLHTYYQSLNTIITTSDSTPNTECHKTFELMISVDLMNSLLLFYSLPIAPPIVVPPPSSTLTTINTSNKSNKTPSLPLNKPPPPATNKPSLIKSPSVTELITLYETGRVTSSHTTAVTEGVTLPQTKLGSGSGGGDVKSLSVDTNNSDTNNNNKNKDYIQLAPFASIDLFTILHPHTTTDNYSAADNTNKPPPQYQHITHVSVLDHSILIFSSEVSCVSHSVSGLVNKITIVRIDDLSVTQVYQLPVDERIVDILYPNTADTHNTNNTNNNNTNTTNITTTNNEVYLVTQLSVYCIREDNTTTQIIKRTTTNTNTATSAGDGVKNSDVDSGREESKTADVNSAQLKAQQKDHKAALSILSELINKHQRVDSSSNSNTTTSTASKSTNNTPINTTNTYTNSAPNTIKSSSDKTVTNTTRITLTNSSVLPVSFVSLPRSRSSSFRGGAGVLPPSAPRGTALPSTSSSGGSGSGCGKITTIGSSKECVPSVLQPQPLTYNLMKYINTLRIEYLVELTSNNNGTKNNTSTDTNNTSNTDTTSYTAQLQTLLHTESPHNHQHNQQQPAFYVTRVLNVLVERGRSEEASRLAEKFHCQVDLECMTAVYNSEMM